MWDALLRQASLVREILVLLVAAGVIGGALLLAGRRFGPRRWLAAGLLVLAGLLPPSAILVSSRPNNSIIEMLTFWLISLMPALSVGVCGGLISNALRIFSQLRQQPENNLQQPDLARWTARSSLVLAALLIGMTCNNLYWLLIWDSTADPIGPFWLVLPLLAALSSGLWMLFRLPPHLKWGALYGLLVSALLALLFVFAQRVDFRVLTAQRATRIQLALEEYRQAEGSYPKRLDLLTPKYLFSLPGPVVIYGQDWCYQRDPAAYQLGYLDRRHWSDPNLFAHLASQAGETQGLPPLCARELESFQ